MTLHAGINHIRDGVETQVTAGAEMSVVGLIGTAPNALSSTYQNDQPIFVNTGDPIMVARLGETGTIPKAIAAISANLRGRITAAKVIVIIVEDDADPFKVIDNIVGDEATRTGMWGWLDAGKDLGLIPRLLCVPGYMSQTIDGLSSVALTQAGSGYTSATVSFTGGGGTGATANAVITDGAITAIEITDPGTGYTGAPTVNISGDGTGAAAQATFSQLANKVCANIPTILERLRAIVIPEGPTSGRTAALNWLETLPANMRNFHPVFQDALNGDAAAPEPEPLTPYLIGAYVSQDAVFDGVPSHGIAGQPLYGMIGVTQTVDFSFTDPNSEGQDYIGRSMGIVARGESGVEDAISSSGFVFWGTDTLSEEIKWQFTHVVRLRDYFELAQVKAEKKYLGKNNVTLQTIQKVLNTLDNQIRQLLHDNHIIGGRVGFNPNANSPEELREGEIDVIFEAEEPPVFKKLNIRSRGYRQALVDLSVTVSNQLTNV